MPATWNGSTRGLDDLNGTAATLEQLGAPADALGNALRQAAGVVIREASALAPKRSGALAGSMIPVIPFSTSGQVAVDIFSTSPYAWNFHAAAGRTTGDNGGGAAQTHFIFDVPDHTRNGYHVNSYRTARRLPNNPFMFIAFDRKADQATEFAVAAIDGLLAEWSTNG